MGNKYQDRHSIINCRNFSSIYRHSTHSCEPNFDRICKPNISFLRPWTSHRSYVKKNGYRVFQKYRKLHILFINFRIFSKKAKQAILFRDFLGEKCVDRKNGVHHDDQRGKTNKIAISDFSFSKLCHRDFCKTFS